MTWSRRWRGSSARDAGRATDDGDHMSSAPTYPWRRRRVRARAESLALAREVGARRSRIVICLCRSCRVPSPCSRIVAFVAVSSRAATRGRLSSFDVGVLRWTWRVGLVHDRRRHGADRYLPFTLRRASCTTRPAWWVSLPRAPRPGVRVIGGWLLGIPHYVIAGAFAGGGSAMWRVVGQFGWPGLIGALALIAAVVLLFTGRYPRSMFDFLIGLNRWVLRRRHTPRCSPTPTHPSDSTLASMSCRGSATACPPHRRSAPA